MRHHQLHAFLFICSLLCISLSSAQTPEQDIYDPTEIGDITQQVFVLDPPLSEILSTQEWAAVSHLDNILQNLILAEQMGQIDANTNIENFELITHNRLSELAQTIDGKVIVDITVRDDIDTFIDTLKLLPGSQLMAVAHANYYSVISAAIPADQLLPMAMIDNLLTATSSMATTGQVESQSPKPPLAYKSQGSANNQAETALEVEALRAIIPGTNGQGISIGTLSDSINRVGTGVTGSQNSNDLPGNANINILADWAGANPTDEGRAMMELIYDIAPSVDTLGFATAFGGVATFANNITALANAGMDVINDDVINFNEPVFQDGVVAQAVNSYVQGGGIYFALNHNYANLSYQGIFSDPDGDNFHNYSNNDEAFSFSMTAGANSMRFGLYWAEAQASATVDLRLEIWSADLTTMLANSTTNNIGGNPVDLLSFTNTTGVTSNFAVVIRRISGTPNNLPIKFIIFDNGASRITLNERLNEASGTLTPHAGTPKSIAIGAAPYSDRDNRESFSGIGPFERHFDNNGNPIGPFTYNKPDFLSIDRVNTSFFGTDDPNDADALPNFSGTSAATPNAAAVATLMLQRAGGPGTLDQEDIRTAMRTTAIDLGAAGHDTSYGYGRIHALLATLAATGPNPVESIVYLNQFGDGSFASTLFSTTDIDSIEFAQNTTGPTLVTVTESHATMNPMAIIFAQVADTVQAFDLDSGPIDDVLLNFDALGGIPYTIETLSENAFTNGPASYTLTINTVDQRVTDRTPNLNASGDDLNYSSSLFIIGDSDYLQYSAPFDGSLDITLHPVDLTGRLIAYDQSGNPLDSNIAPVAQDTTQHFDSISMGDTFVFQVVSNGYNQTGDYLFSANFTPTQTSLNVQLSGSGTGHVNSDIPGISCNPTCSATYDQGTQLILTASATGGSQFNGWTGDCTPNGLSCSVTMNQSKSIQAVFVSADTLFSDSFE